MVRQLQLSNKLPVVISAIDSHSRCPTASPKSRAAKSAVAASSKSVQLPPVPVVESHRKTATKVYVNLAEPELADKIASRNVDGVGLLRAEFMIAGIGTHPKKLIADKKEHVFIDKLDECLQGRTIDYLVINHMEPDHSASIKAVKNRWPNIKIVGNSKTFTMLNGYFGINENLVEVKEGSEICIGKRCLQFIMTPMVHWIETMMTYDKTEGILFSGDAFGCFGALNGAVLDCDPVHQYGGHHHVGLYGPYAGPWLCHRFGDFDLYVGEHFCHLAPEREKLVGGQHSYHQG